MSDDKNVLLEEACYRITVTDQENDYEQPQAFNNDTNLEIISEDESHPYKFLQNCSSAALWICVLYNFSMISLIVLVCIYKRLN
ncbi:uncharacterized protein LOC108149283 [Drosophila elegans]|uniref:uncharacterized protein LOC108149283 n=1 Tax=Drosophila elegans TaxID=30023 RepID=UPI0007E672CD|nr:uncharacterized protein LOC108149283 [Drosophila elegans]